MLLLLLLLLLLLFASVYTPGSGEVFSKNTGQLAYVQTRLRTNSPTTCQLAYVGDFTQVIYNFYNFMLSVFSTMSKILFRLARLWMKERGISCMALSVEFIYLTSRLARQCLKERRITHFTHLWGTANSSMMVVIKFAYVGELTSRRRRVGEGEFARRRVDRIPFQNTPYPAVWNYSKISTKKLIQSSFNLKSLFRNLKRFQLSFWLCS